MKPTRAKIDYALVRELRDKGLKLREIADKVGCHKATISKVLKKMNMPCAEAAIDAAPRYQKGRDKATDALMYLLTKARTELEWVEKEVKPSNTEDYREWQNQKLKFAAEMRKVISAMADIGYKLFKAAEVDEILQIMDEEIGFESIECQKRIRDRIAKRRAIRFPYKLD